MNGNSRSDGTPVEERRLGMIVSGSLADGVEVRLDHTTSIEEIKVGSPVTIEGERLRFFGVVTDVCLNSTDPTLRLTPPDVSNPYVSQVISGTMAYGTISVEPKLTLSNDSLSMIDGPQPAKTVPPHFSPVSLASERDIQLVFGQRGRNPLLDRQPAGHGDQALPRLGRVRQAQ